MTMYAFAMEQVYMCGTKTRVGKNEYL